MTAADELLARLREPGGYAELLRRAATTPRARLIRRCALVSEIDRKVFETVLRDEAEGFTFDEVMAWPELELVPGTEDRCRVRNRAAVLDDWTAKADTVLLQRLHARLAAHFKERGPGHAPRVLYHLLRVDPNQARTLFVQLYDLADAAFDLPRCQELLAAVNERYDDLRADFHDDVDKRIACFAARTYWSDEYYRSFHYLERTTQSTAFTNFLEGEPWIANVYAEGGMGKTAALRWLIARVAVPARIPVARIDFDFEDAYTATTNPVWMLEKITKQLDPQMPGSPFQSLLGMLTGYTARLSGSRTAIGGFAEDALVTFGERLAEVRPELTTLLVFDTVEVAVVHEDLPFDPLLDLLQRIHGLAPAVRVILAGRYDMSKRLPAFRALGEKDEAVDIPIEPFEFSDAYEYLVHRRGVPEDLAKVVIRKSAHDEKGRTLPFKLALYGDFLRTDKIDPAELESYDRIDVIHLIERVIKRLSIREIRREGSEARSEEELRKEDRRLKRLQWLLRYGVVARRLTLPFVRDVVADLLAPSLAGTVDYDNANAGLPKHLHGKVFTHDLLAPGEALDVDELWGDLSRFAAERSWVSVDRNHPDMLAFHVNVETPMRRLIENEPVYRELHRRAIRHYDAVTREGGARWTWAARQAIYHRFYAGASDVGDAEAYWRAAIVQARRISPEAEREIAREITGRDYFDGAQPVVRAGVPIVSLSMIAEAHTIEAESYARQARRTGEHDLWQKAGVAASFASIFSRSDADEALRRRIAMVRAGIALASGDFAAAEQLIAFEPSGAGETLSHELLLAEAADAQSDEEASAVHLMRARDLFGHGDLPELFDREAGDVEKAVVDGTVRYARVNGRFDIALGELASARDREVARGAIEAATERAFDYGQVLLEAGLPGTARYHVSMVVQIDNDSLYRIQRFTAEAQLAIFEPVAALRTCDELAEQLGRAQDSIAARGWLHELRARALAQLMNAADARLEFERAIRTWEAAGRHEDVLRTMQTAAEVELRQLGGTAIAREFLAQAERTSGISRAAVWRNLMLRAELEQEPPDSPNSSPRSVPEAISRAVTRLRIGARSDAGAAANALIQLLPAVRPTAARLPLLAGFVTVPEIPIDSATRATFASLLGNPLAEEDDEWRYVAADDRLRLALVAVHVLAATRNAMAAIATLQQLRSVIDSSARPLLAREVDRASRRLWGSSAPILADRRMLEVRFARFPGLIERWRVEDEESGIDRKLEEAVSSQPMSAAPETEELSVVDVELTASGVTWHDPRSGPVFAERRSPMQLFEPRLRLRGTGREGELLPRRLVTAFAENLGEAVDRLRAYLFDDSFGRRFASLPFDIRLRTQDSSWHALPWEFAVAGTPHLRLLHRGSTGPALASCTTERVLVLRSSEQRMSPVESYYRNAGGEVIVVDPMEQPFESILFEFRPALVHIGAPVIESTTRGGVALQFSSRGNEVPASYLAKLLFGGENPPFIILDPPRPVGAKEAVRQLMLRNAFAGELFAVGTVAGILGTGLFGDLGEHAYSTLARLLARPIPAADVARQLGYALARSSDKPELDTILATAGIALFANRADMLLT